MTPGEGGKNGGKIQDTVRELLGATIRTRFEAESRCQCLRVCRCAREAVCLAVLVSRESETEKVIPVIQQRPLFPRRGITMSPPSFLLSPRTPDGSQEQLGFALDTDRLDAGLYGHQ